MKCNISELLKDIEVNDVSLTDQTPLSSNRIKQRTMERIGARKM